MASLVSPWEQLPSELKQAVLRTYIDSRQKSHATQLLRHRGRARQVFRSELHALLDVNSSFRAEALAVMKLVLANLRIEIQILGLELAELHAWKCVHYRTGGGNHLCAREAEEKVHISPFPMEPGEDDKLDIPLLHFMCALSEEAGWAQIVVLEAIMKKLEPNSGHVQA